jgi:predicted nucleic acid-binding protein
VRDSEVRYVLDSFALLAYLNGEEGHQRVAQILGQAQEEQTRLYLSIINYGEVAYIVERARGLTQAHRTIAAVDQLPIEVIEADRRLTFAAAHIKANYPLAYADCFTIALAQEKGATVLTGDPEFRAVDSLATIEWLRATHADE